MRVPRGGLLLLLFAQPPAPGLHLAFPSKANFLPSRSVHSLRLGCCKSLPGHQLGTLSRQPSQCGKFSYLLARGWEVPEVGPSEKRSVECLSTSAEAVQSAKGETDADERRRKKWIADREAEQAEVQRGKRIWLGDGKLVYSSKVTGSREESSRPRGDNGGPRYKDTLSDSAGEPREIAGSRGRGTGAGGVRGRGGGRGAGRGRGIGRGRGEFSGAAAAEVRSSRNFVRQEPTYSEGVIERSSEASASDSPRDLSTSGRTSRGTFGRGGSGRGGYGRGQENGSESSYGGYGRGGFSRGGFSRGRGGPTRGGLGRGESGRGGFSRGGFSRGGFSRGGFSRGGLSRGGPGRGGYSRGETSRNDENESDIDNGSTDASEEGLGRPGSTRGGTRGSYGRGGLSRGGSSRGGFTRGSSTRGGLSRGRGYGRGELTSRSDRNTDDGSNDGSDGGFSRGRAASGRGSFRGSSSRGGYGRGNFNSDRDSETSTAGSDQFEGRPGEFSRERGGFSRGRGGISRGRGGFSRGRGSSSGGGYSRETSSGLDNDNLGRDNRRTERFEGGRGGIGRGRGSFRGRDQRPQDRLGTEVSLASGKYAQQAADESDDSDEELPVTKTFSGREDAVSLFEEDSDVSEAEDNEGITAGDRDHLDRGKSDVLGKQSSEAPGTEAGNTGSGGAIQANEVDDLPAGTQRLQREAGEENWQFMVRKKRADTQKESENVGLEVENGVTEYQSEAYKQRKVAWLCKEIPFLGPRDTVSILNAQKRWITAAEAKQVIKHLMEIDHSIRAYRVHRWMVDQGRYEFDFKLQTELANLLCQLDTTRRARELFDQIINSRNVPDSSTYVALINKYIEEKVVPSIEEAWSLFNQMQQLGGYERPASLQHALFDALLQKTQVTPVFAERADMLFQIMKETGTERTREMFESLMTYHARKGNSTRVAALSEEMILEGIEVGSNVFSKMVDASAEEGSPEKAEKAFKDLLEAGYMADVSVYISLMTAYGKAGRYAEALEKFESMEGAGIKANARAFDIITSLMAYSGQQADAEALLQRMESSGRVPSLLTYNALIEMYGKKGLSDEAEKVFKQMLSHDRLPNKSTYVSLIEHYVQKGSLEDAEAMYEEMRDKVAVAHKAYCLMLEAYGKAGQKDKLKEIFEHPTSRRFSIPDDCKKYLLGVVSRKDIEGRAETKVTLQKSQRKALMGVLLGGARVETHDKDRTYEVHFELDPEGPGSSTVIDHLYQTFSEWAAAPPEIIASQADQESHQSSTRRGFATVSHGSFRFFSHQFRSEGKPIIPRLIHRWLGPECLAYWYMYGGQRCDETGGIILHVANYSQKEIILVRKALQQISLDSDVKERGGKRVLQLEGQSAQWMWKLIEPHVVEELKDLFRPFSKPETDQANGSSILDTGPRASESPSRTIANGVGKSSAELPMAEAVQAM